MRPIRCNQTGELFEITTRVKNRQLLLRPSPKVNNIIQGVIGRAQLHSNVKLHAYIFLSTHYHMLASADSSEEMSRFMQMINANITKKLNALHDLDGPMWQRRFRSIPVAADEATQSWRLRYILSHGVKERLVARVADWPGATSLGWLLRGKKASGIWTDFTARYHAQRKKNYVPQRGEFDTKYEIELTVLPCWAHLPDEIWRQRVAELVDDIDTQAAQTLESSELKGSECGKTHRILGVAAVLATDPTSRLPRQRRSRAPSVLALQDCVRRMMRSALLAIRRAYAEASAQFRCGEWGAIFPVGTFRPGGWTMSGNVTHLSSAVSL